MKLMKCEQEVYISFCADEKTATLYTSYPAWIRKMDKLVGKTARLQAHSGNRGRQDLHHAEKLYQHTV